MSFLDTDTDWQEDHFQPTETRDGCEQLLQCRDIEEADALMRKLALSYGFDHYLYSIRLPVEGGSAIERVITNYAPAWRQRYQANDFASIDPTVQHCMRRVTPIRWTADLYVSAAQKQLREEARRYGLRSGLSIPVHGILGETAMLNLAIDKDEAEVHEFIDRMAPFAQCLASYAHEAFRQCLLHELRQMDTHLTPREAECLRWVSRGKTNWEMARILAISEHGVAYHLRKLQVASRHQAVRRAVALGLIDI